MLPEGWEPGESSAIRAFHWLQDEGVLQIAYWNGRHAYDFPCTSEHLNAFRRAPSRGRYVEQVLRPYAVSRGWTQPRRHPLSW